VLIPQLFADAVDVIAIRQNMLGIKARAEGAEPPAPATVYTELAFWMAASLCFLAAEAGLVVRRDWLRPGLAVSAIGLITIGPVLLKPQVWVDGLFTPGAFVGLWWMYRLSARRAVPVSPREVASPSRPPR
jgi:hypothetical protein